MNVFIILRPLISAGLGTAPLTNVQELLSHEITVFKDWVRIDVQTVTPGLNFQEAWEHRETMTFQGQIFYVLSKKDLISSKRASGRDVDLEDVRLLELPENKEEELGIFSISIKKACGIFITIN